MAESTAAAKATRSSIRLISGHGHRARRRARPDAKFHRHAEKGERRPGGEADAQAVQAVTERRRSGDGPGSHVPGHGETVLHAVERGHLVEGDSRIVSTMKTTMAPGLQPDEAAEKWKPQPSRDRTPMTTSTSEARMPAAVDRPSMRPIAHTQVKAGLSP